MKISWLMVGEVSGAAGGHSLGLLSCPSLVSQGRGMKIKKPEGGELVLCWGEHLW